MSLRAATVKLGAVGSSIVTDYDISDFPNRVAVPRIETIADPEQREILEKVIEEQKLRSQLIDNLGQALDQAAKYLVNDNVRRNISLEVWVIRLR